MTNHWNVGHHSFRQIYDGMQSQNLPFCVLRSSSEKKAVGRTVGLNQEKTQYLYLYIFHTYTDEIRMKYEGNTKVCKWLQLHLETYESTKFSFTIVWYHSHGRKSERPLLPCSSCRRSIPSPLEVWGWFWVMLWMGQRNSAPPILDAWNPKNSGIKQQLSQDFFPRSVCTAPWLSCQPCTRPVKPSGTASVNQIYMESQENCHDFPIGQNRNLEFHVKFRECTVFMIIRFMILELKLGLPILDDGDSRLKSSKILHQSINDFSSCCSPQMEVS